MQAWQVVRKHVGVVCGLRACRRAFARAAVRPHPNLLTEPWFVGDGFLFGCWFVCDTFVRTGWQCVAGVCEGLSRGWCFEVGWRCMR